SKDLKYAQKHMENIKRMEKPTEEKCERCGSPLVIKWGRHGSFYACSAYKKDDPESCTFTKENPIDLPDLDTADLQETTQEEYCENCGRPMVLKRGRFGQFMACTGYPECKTTRRLDQAKKVPDIPLDEKCPECGHPYLVEKILKSGPVIACPNKGGDEEDQPKRRRKKAVEGKPAVKCNYSRPVPTPAVVA